MNTCATQGALIEKETDMKTKHNIDIAEYLKTRPHTFVSGFIDSLYSKLPRAPGYNKQDYYDGYADGSFYKDELSGVSPFCIIRRV